MKLENYPSAYYHLKLASYWKNNNIELLNNLAICAQYVNDKTIIAPASLYYINKAIELNEDNFNLYKTRANIQKKLGNDKEYLNNLKEAYRILKGITSENSVKYINILGVKYQSEVKNAVGKEIKKLEKIIEK